MNDTAFTGKFSLETSQSAKIFKSSVNQCCDDMELFKTVPSFWSI